MRRRLVDRDDAMPPRALAPPGAAEDCAFVPESAMSEIQTLRFGGAVAPAPPTPSCAVPEQRRRAARVRRCAASSWSRVASTAGAAWHPQLAPRGIHSWRRGGPIASLTHATRPPPLRSAAHPVVRGGGADRLTVPCDQDGNGFADDVRAPLGWQREAHAFWWRREQARHGRLCARKAVRVLRGLRAVPLDLHGARLCTGRIADPNRPVR
jgi:hypothetical protein